MCLIAYRRQWSRGTVGTSERDGPRFAKGKGERRGGQMLTGRALRKKRSGGRSDADGPGFAERAERGQVRC